MKIQILSDIHLDFSKNFNFMRNFLENQKCKADVLILAGDTMPFVDRKKIHKIYNLMKDYDIVLEIPGNHEYYHSPIVPENFKYKEIDGNIIRLNNEVYTHCSVRFICSTLWSHTTVTSSEFLNDFIVIKNMTVMEYNRLHDECRRFIKESKKEDWDGKTVVITHHLPSWKCIHDNFLDNPINDCYASHCEDLLEGVDLWVHGHSHNPYDQIINGTRVVRNPLGYQELSEGRFFKHNFVVEL
jgi:predicted phosphodiesterase